MLWIDYSREHKGLCYAPKRQKPLVAQRQLSRSPNSGLAGTSSRALCRCCLIIATQLPTFKPSSKVPL